MTVIIMGAAGSGKTTVGQLLAAELGWIFLDADWLHSAANIAKMTSGIPLTDSDREPWLAAIHERILDAFQQGKNLVVACSALKERYRETLSRGVGITWVYLKGTGDQISERLKLRQHHFMTARLLASQFADLEEPANAIVVDISLAPEVAARLMTIEIRRLMAPHQIIATEN
jgi:gluconokinase